MNRKGEYVQRYTRRGAIMRNKYRWRTNRERVEEIISLFMIVLLSLSLLLMPVIMWTILYW